jgi:hypothetical protein
MAYFSDPNEMGGFGCGADCSCKSCRGTTANLSQVYEKEEPPPPAPTSPSAVPKMGGWLGAYSLGRARPFAAARFGWPGWGFGQPAVRAALGIAGGRYPAVFAFSLTSISLIGASRR